MPPSKNSRTHMKPQQSQRPSHLRLARVSDFAPGGDDPTAIARDDSFYSRIDHNTEEVLDTTGNKNKAGAIATMPSKCSGGLSSKGRILRSHDKPNTTTNPSEIESDDESQPDPAVLLRNWRYLLQRNFLSEGKSPKREDIQIISSYLGELENGPDLPYYVIKATKIRLALSEVLRLENIPNDSEFNFRNRFEGLLKRFTKITADDTNQPLGYSKTNVGKDGRSTMDAGGSKRKREVEPHVLEENKRLKQTPEVIIIDSEDEDSSKESCEQPDYDLKWMNDAKRLVTDSRELVTELLGMLEKQQDQISEQTVKVKALAQFMDDIMELRRR